MNQLKSLLKTVKSYTPDFDPKIITLAHDYAKEKHEGQTRVSGEPYYTHPMEVAQILADMKMDEPTIVTAILHDTLEDTSATFEDLEEKFSKEVADLVNGVSKLTKIESQTFEGKQAENFRKLTCWRCPKIFVCCSSNSPDRLHNMRTLYHFKDRPDKCTARISKETLGYLCAALAERIGMHQIKRRACRPCPLGYLNPEAKETISPNRLEFLARRKR